MLSVSRWLSCPYPAVHAKDQVRQLCCRIAPYIGISLLRVCPSACKRPADWKRDAEGVGPTTADFHLESYHGCCQVSRCLNFWYALFRHQRPREFCEFVTEETFSRQHLAIRPDIGSRLSWSPCMTRSSLKQGDQLNLHLRHGSISRISPMTFCLPVDNLPLALQQFRYARRKGQLIILRGQ